MVLGCDGSRPHGDGTRGLSRTEMHCRTARSHPNQQSIDPPRQAGFSPIGIALLQATPVTDE